MHKRDYGPLLAELSDAYARYAPASQALNRRAQQHLVDGGSHSLRLIEPFPPRIAAARGAWLTDEDGHRLLDFWQGHLANILGHNPPVVTEALARAFDDGFGLQTGFTDRLQIEAAEILCQGHQLLCRGHRRLSAGRIGRCAHFGHRQGRGQWL
ncbi:MAG: aminotransferase class III-fold pyridoxal phosphate-dependent enzyme [Anaerolineae bacterium]